MDDLRPTLYERIGGKAAVDQLVDEFYSRVLADPELKPFFIHTPMDRLRHMQYQFFSAALDGPDQYSGEPIYAVHHGKGIDTHHLSLFMDHLLATIKAAHPDEQDVCDIIHRINLYTDEITGSTNFPD